MGLSNKKISLSSDRTLIVWLIKEFRNLRRSLSKLQSNGTGVDAGRLTFTI